MRIAHYVVSTHWDREWYESFQGYRLRLVSLLDETLSLLQHDPCFKSFVMDGQTIPVLDYLEIRPEKRELIRALVAKGKFKIGPWYVLPDEWLVSGESLIRNIQLGMDLAGEFGAPSSRAGFACDLFGHISQLPQLFDQLGIPAAMVWRGTSIDKTPAYFSWKAPDGTILPTYRFGWLGYCTLAFDVRKPQEPDRPFVLEEMANLLVAATLAEAKRASLSPILLFDGCDHVEPEPTTPLLIARANDLLASHGIQIMQSDLDAFLADLVKERDKIKHEHFGEMRESGKLAFEQDAQWLIPGVLSSRIHLKQRNADCEDELTNWAEPFCAFAAQRFGMEYPEGFLRTAWKHLLENHPHDSICGCSIDQVHQDMIYRFDQSLGISSRLTHQVMKSIAMNAIPAGGLRAGTMSICLFNATNKAIDEPVDIAAALPADWSNKFQEFFGFEDKFAFKLHGPDGNEVPYQLVSQERNRLRIRKPRYKLPASDSRNIVNVTAHLKIPAWGYTSLLVEPATGPVRYLGSLVTGHNTMENECISVKINSNGTIDLLDKRNDKVFSQLLIFEQRADIGDGWFHGAPVSDQIYNSSGVSADVSLISDGINKATFRVAITMNVPEDFNFANMTRSSRSIPLKIVSDVTLRNGVDRVEITTVIENHAKDHRVRVLFPTGLQGETYLSDSPFDVVERPIALAADNHLRREVDIETRPQVTWTAFGDGKAGLAVVSRGLPESSVLDHSQRTIAVTLLRAFRRAFLANENMGGQIQGTHRFNYWIVPFRGEAPRQQLCLFGQRVNNSCRQVDVLPRDLAHYSTVGTSPRTDSFLRVLGDVVITSVQQKDGKLLVRLYNPNDSAETIRLTTGRTISAVTSLRLDGSKELSLHPKIRDGKTVEAAVSPKRIATLLLAIDGAIYGTSGS